MTLLQRIYPDFESGVEISSTEVNAEFDNLIEAVNNKLDTATNQTLSNIFTFTGRQLFRGGINLASTITLSSLGDLWFDPVAKRMKVYADNEQTVITDMLQAQWSIKLFGAKGDGVSDDTAGLDAAFATLPTRALYVPKGIYLYRGTGLTIPKGAHVVFEGGMRWQLNTYSTQAVDPSSGACIVCLGTGSKQYTVDHVSNMDVSGGVVNSPYFDHTVTPAVPKAGINSTMAPKRSLINLTNANATGATRATLKPFSVGLRIHSAARVINPCVIVGRDSDTNKLACYNSETHNALADDWDVGIWLDNATQTTIDTPMPVGYWRLAGWLMTCVSRGTSDVPSSEYNSIYDGTFQGYRGLAIRSHDSFRVISKTVSSITIPWSASHRFSNSGSIRIGSSVYDYTGLTYATGPARLTLTGISDTSAITTSSWCRNVSGIASGNFGFSGTHFHSPVLGGLNHASRCLSTNPAISGHYEFPSCAMEISGDVMRGIEFHQPTFMTSEEVVIHLHDCNDIVLDGYYGEAQTARSAIGGSFNIESGGDFIASPFIDDNTRVPYPAGETSDLRLVDGKFNSVNLLPSYASSNIERFNNHGGLFTPRLDDMFVDPGVGKRVVIGPHTGNCQLQARNGEADIRSATGSDLLRLRNGTTTGATLSTSAFTVVPGIQPSIDNTVACGTSGARWTQVSAASGTINTSDERAKEAIVASDLGLGFINSLRPVSYKYKNYSTKHIDDNEQEQVINRTFVRRHYGLIAQEVKAVLGNKDAGLWIYDTASDLQGLRYSEFIAPMIKATQELSAKVAALETQNTLLSAELGALKVTVATLRGRPL